MRLRDVVVGYQWQIALVLGLVIIENVAWIVEPGLFGPVLDALIATANKEPGASAVLPLTLWVLAFGINSAVGALRRSMEPRVYLRLYADVAGRVVDVSRRRQLSVATTAARASLSRELVWFLQYQTPEALEQAIAVGGAAIGLAMFDYRIAAACALVVLPVLVLRRLYGRRVLPLQRDVHDRLETAFDQFQDMNPEQVRAYYLDVAAPQRRIANWGAASFGSMRLVLLAVFMVVLYVAIDLDDFSTGQLYSIVAYLWTFVTSVEYVPEVLENWSGVQDLSVRLRATDEFEIAELAPPPAVPSAQ